MRFGQGFSLCGREPGCAGGRGRRDGLVFSQLSCVQRPLNSFCDILWNRKSFGDQPFANGVVTLLCAQPFWNFVGPNMVKCLVGNFWDFNSCRSGFGRRSLLAVFQFPFRRAADRFDCRQWSRCPATASTVASSPIIWRKLTAALKRCQIARSWPSPTPVSRRSDRAPRFAVMSASSRGCGSTRISSRQRWVIPPKVNSGVCGGHGRRAGRVHAISISLWFARTRSFQRTTTRPSICAIAKNRQASPH